MLYIPELTTNLLSVGASAAKGTIAKFKNESCELIHNDKIVAIGRRVRDKLYKLDFASKGEQALLIKGSRSLYVA